MPGEGLSGSRIRLRLLRSGQYPKHRRAADRELAGDLRWADSSSAKLPYFFCLRPGCGGSASVLPLGLSLSDADEHALPNELSLKLSDCAEHVEHEPSCRRGRVDGLIENLQPHALGV
jgi:hypothetical protein